MSNQKNDLLHELSNKAAMLAAVYYHNEDEDSLEQLNEVVETIARYGYHIHLKPHGLKAHPQVSITLWREGRARIFFPKLERGRW